MLSQKSSADITHATPGLQQRVTDDNLQKPLETFSALLDDGIVELVEVDLSGQRGNGDAGALALEYVAKVFKVGVTATDAAVAQFERGDVCAQADLVGRVARRGSQAVGLRVAYLVGETNVSGEKTMQKRITIMRLTSISRKFSGGPYISSKLCDLESGIACMVAALLRL